MSVHSAVLELSNVLLAQVLVDKPVDLPLPVKPAILKLSLVVDTSRLLGELTTKTKQKKSSLN